MVGADRDRRRPPARRSGAGLLACLVAAAGAAGSASGASRLVFEDRVKANGSSSVTVTVNRSAAFSVTMKTRTEGRTRLYLTGSTAPRGGPLLDTRDGACEGAAGSWMCRGAYQALPAGTYKFRVLRTGVAANVVLTVRW
ncbi:MAG: hypothetical protein H0W96_13930 [Solirubrobacterales bacterium]|nr:hypothetical protein [Solirubrobacterales bacterium]